MWKTDLSKNQFIKVKNNKTFLSDATGRIGMFLFILIGLISLSMISCAQLNTVGEQIQSVYWDIQKTMRKPGEKLITHPDKVWEKYQCASKELPMLVVETNEILPPQLNSGEELNHHFTYIMCPASPSQVIKGRLTRLIYYEGRIIFKDITDDFELKPGEWSVDAFVDIPSQAKPGVYSFEVKFSNGEHAFSKSRHFVVK